MGWATDSSRPANAAIRSDISITSRAEPSVTLVVSSRPDRSTKMSSGPFTRMSPTSGSSTSGCNGPRPQTTASTEAMRAGDASRSSSGSARISPIVRRSSASLSDVRANGLRTSGDSRATSIRRTVPRVAAASGTRARSGTRSLLIARHFRERAARLARPPACSTRRTAGAPSRMSRSNSLICRQQGSKAVTGRLCFPKNACSKATVLDSINPRSRPRSRSSRRYWRFVLPRVKRITCSLSISTS
mgnify:CR=1 FL=1